MTSNKPSEWTDPGAWARPQSNPRLVVIAASAGGLAAVRRVLAVLVQAIRAVTAGEVYLSPDLIRATSFAGAASGERF